MNSKNESFRWKMYKSRGTCSGTGGALPASKEQRVEKLHEQRRHSRWGEMLKRRNIADGTMSPIYSPCISNDKGVENAQMLSKGEKRMELLKKWQQERKKQLQTQKASAKPVFKVHHVSQPPTYDLDMVYKQIKGQPIAASSKHNVQEAYRLVSGATYKFKPPSNIKPMPLSNKQKLLGSKGKTRTFTTRQQRSPSTQQATSKTNFVTRANSRLKNQESQPSTSGAVQKAGTITNAIMSSSESSSSRASPAIHKSRNDRSTRRRSTRHEVKGEDTSSTEASDKEKEPSERNKRKSRQFRQSLSKTRSSFLCTETANPETANGTTESSDSDRIATPSNKNMPSNVVYVSPFVTMSRGKDNARKEYHRRSTPGGTGNKEKQSPYAKHDESKSTSPKAAATYFYKLLMDQTVRLQSLCEKWNYYKDEHNSQEEVCDMINVAIGQTDLLIQKKFKQFKGLIQCCESEDTQRRVTCLDLHGFWDTMMIQINNLDQRFDNLERLKQNNWEEILPLPQPKKKGRPKKQASKKPATSSSGLKALIQAARKKKAAGDDNPHLLSVPSTSNACTPVKTPSRLTRSSLRVSVLTSETQRKLSSPGLVMTKVTQIAKSAERSVYLTPLEAPRSILKAERSKSVRRKSKVVLFKDTDSSDEDKENQNSSNLIDFSEDIVNKTPVRRSSRKKINNATS